MHRPLVRAALLTAGLLLAAAPPPLGTSTWRREPAPALMSPLPPSSPPPLLDAAFDKLRPGAPIVLETINPACWFAFFESYVRDITHVRPLHPDTLKFLLVASGFERVEIRYRAPYPEHDKLQPLPVVEPLRDVIETVNANADKLNRLLFTHLDYAAIGYRA